MSAFLSERPRILIVDDEPMSRTVMDAVLRTEDRYDVVVAGNGQEGLDMARRQQPDLVLLNVAICGALDGVAVCRALKSEPRTRRIPIVLVMARAASQERIEGFEAGADDFLVKPFNRIEVLARVRSLLRIKALNDQLDEVEDIIYSLSRMIEAREGTDNSTHSRRVAAFASALGREIGLSDESLRLLQQAAMLRDVGKISLPDHILRNPGVLSPEEKQRMERHPVLGEEVIAPLRSTAALLPIIRHHHERVDGKGYPDGLAGDQIPLGARILAIADAYEAMISPRPYRPALSSSRALATLQQGAGKQWDTRLTALFVAWTERQADEPAVGERG